MGDVPRHSSHRSKAWWLSAATLVSIFVVNTLGFADTVTGSALGCGHNWPLCNGALIPSQWTQAVAIEFTHRVSVFVALLLFIALTITVFRKYGWRRDVLVCFGLMLAGVLIEAVLGAITVLFGNPPAIMAMHMGIALLSFAGVVLLTVVISHLDGSAQWVTAGKSSANERAFRRTAWFAVAYCYAAIYIGAYVASTGAGDVARGWPLPAESPQTSGFAFALDVLHRSVALGFLLLAVVLWQMARRMRAERPVVYRTTVAILWLVLLQGASGGILIASHIAVYAFLLHVTIVSLLFAALCLLVFLAGAGASTYPFVNSERCSQVQ